MAVKAAGKNVFSGAWSSGGRLLSSKFAFVVKALFKTLNRVVSSEQYTGVAEMISDIEFSKTFGYWWEESKWSGIFQVKWHFVKDVRYDAFSNLYE